LENNALRTKPFARQPTTPIHITTIRKMLGRSRFQPDFRTVFEIEVLLLSSDVSFSTVHDKVFSTIITLVDDIDVFLLLKNKVA